ncbi:tetratricopeptide repeat protein [Pelagerythrobacter sp.]|uniref:tetratricopeptide repeat protein n=1 Tax=Pelagerythrobacter sp. TaxID=2800702 RepID=UPI0035B1C834
MISSPDTRLLRWVAALALFALAGCEEPAPSPAPLESAETALARGDGLGAEIALRRLLDDGAPRERLAAYFGEAELAQGNLAEARQWLGPAEFAPGSRARGLRMLGILEMRSGNLAAAGAALDRSLAVDALDPELWVAIGRLRYLGGEQAQAVEASRRAVTLGPHNPEALRFRGQLVRDAHGMTAALPWFEAAIEADPDNIDLLADYAATLGEAGRARDMLAAVRRMAEINPGDPRLFVYQAALAARAGDFDLARGLLSRAGDAERMDAASALLAGVIDLQEGNPATAAQAFDRLLRSQPDNRRVRQLLARALHLAGNDRELVYRFAAEAAAPGAEPYLAQIVGRAYEALGERDKAAPLLEKAAGADRSGLTALAAAIPLEVAQARGGDDGRDAVSLVRGLIAAGRTDAAIRAAEVFRGRFRGSADALGLAGDAYLAADDPERALDRYRAAAEIRRSWPLARRMLAAHVARGDRAGAWSLLSDHLAGEPANREVAAMFALLAFDARRSEQGEAALAHALAGGGSRDPQLLALAAQIALQDGDAAAARDAAERAYALQRRNPLARRAIVRALDATGEEETAEVLARDIAR